jgi:integrase
LRWWWEHRPIKDNPRVFLCLDDNQIGNERYGKPFKYRLQFMRRMCDKAKVKRFGFHSIRHLSASILYNLGYEVAVIQTILRHQNPTTTEGYLRSLGLEKARAALESLSQKKGEVIPWEGVARKVGTE